MNAKQKQQLYQSSYREQRLTFAIERTDSTIERFRKLRSLTLKVSTLCLSTFYFGYCLVYLSTISRQSMIKQFGYQSQTVNIHGFLYGVLTLGGAIGSFVSPRLMKRYTRRNLIILLNCGALVVQGMIQYPNLICLIVCRIFQGFFMGHFMTLIPAYISELSPKDVVGNFKVFNQLFFVSGILFAYVLGAIITKSGIPDHIKWRLMFGFNILVILYLLLNCLFGFIPESPKSYIRKGMKEEAIKVIKLFVKKDYVEDVFREKLIQVKNQLKNITNSRQKGPSYSKKAYFIGFLLPIMQPWTGINAITTQMGIMLQNHKFEFGYYVPIVICFVLFGSIFGAIYTSKQFGRRTILLSGGLGLGVCDVMMGICFIFIDQYEGVGWLIFILLIFYMMIYGMTIGPTVWMYIPEIIPGKVVPIAATINMMSSTACLMLSPIITEGQGPSATYFTFGAITLAITLINMFGMVESKGLNPEQIQKAYSGQLTN